MKSFVVNTFWGVYLERSIQENLFRTPYTGNLFATTCSGNLIRENLLGKTYSGKFIQENLFMKTIGHTKSLRKWLVDVLNSIFAK